MAVVDAASLGVQDIKAPSLGVGPDRGRAGAGRFCESAGRLAAAQFRAIGRRASGDGAARIFGRRGYDRAAAPVSDLQGLRHALLGPGPEFGSARDRAGRRVARTKARGDLSQDEAQGQPGRLEPWRDHGARARQKISAYGAPGDHDGFAVRAETHAPIMCGASIKRDGSRARSGGDARRRSTILPKRRREFPRPRSFPRATASCRGGRASRSDRS